jgi:hypothetical protein
MMSKNKLQSKQNERKINQKQEQRQKEELKALAQN